MGNYKSTGLWQRAFENGTANPHEGASTSLVAAYTIFRERAATLTAQISRSLPSLTIHDVTHLDALWETADLIAGDDYPLNPAEAFVFGGAILLHDAALCFEAYSGGQNGIRECVEWKDAFAAIDAGDCGRSLDQKRDEADFSTMRILHASRAEDLGSTSWLNPEGEPLYLIENYELRKHYGALIGKIAASHHWPIEDILSRLPQQLNALSSMPREWRVDPVKLACLLRCADAAHVDSRRAPDFLRALTKLHGVSADHWKAQNWLERADRDTADPEGHSLIFTSGKAFTEADAQAWWVAFDTIRLIDRELRATADLLKNRPQAQHSPPFQMRRVTGASSPEITSETIQTTGWLPKAVELHVSNLERLVSQLGGTKLYGDSQLLIVSLRELIQNSRDAVSARRAIDRSYVGSIKISVHKRQNEYSLSVEDDGIGMSYRVATGPLLDFGSSFWASDLARSEHPGLLSSGYQSVGQFGIGFYSIFMVATSVSLASRRFDHGLDSVTQVRFPSGLSLRPIISAGAPLGFSYSTNTKVDFFLKPEFGDPAKVLIDKGRAGYEPEVILTLAHCLSIVCAGLDTKVELINEDRSTQVVHQPVQELSTKDKREAWLMAIVGNGSSDVVMQSLREHSMRLRPIIDRGKICGLAALSIVRGPKHKDLGRIETVGGLATTIAPSDLSRYIGYVDYKPASAKRDAQNVPIASTESLKIWATEQKSLLPPWEGNQLDWSFATCSLADMNIDPYDVVTTLVRIDENYHWANLDFLVDLACQHGLALYRSGMMPHVETYHDQGGFEGFPTFWPVTNSAFLSLARDEHGVPDRTSILYCIERKARERGVSIEEICLPGAAKSHFSRMDVLILKGHPQSSSLDQPIPMG